MTHKRKSWAALVLELVMIGIGVFLGASAEQWRDNRHHRELARASLENFRREMANNRDRVVRVRGYHATLDSSLRVFLDGKTTGGMPAFIHQTGFAGTRPIAFDHTAWDLSIATQSLVDVKPALAYEISRAYTVQSEFDDLQKSFYGSAFTPQTLASNDMTGLALAVLTYLGDVNLQEPSLVKIYDRLIPKIDSALGGPSVAGKK